MLVKYLLRPTCGQHRVDRSATPIQSCLSCSCDGLGSLPLKPFRYALTDQAVRAAALGRSGSRRGADSDNNACNFCGFANAL